MSTVATPVLLLLQLPPLIEFPSRLVPPIHTVVPPVTVDEYGNTFTVVVAAVHPATEYEITVVPAVTPVIRPVLLPMVATPVLLLVHTPPVG